MSCENYLEMLALMVSGDLPAHQTRRLHEHLQGCAGCRKFEVKLREGRQTLIGLAAAEEPPVSIRAEVLQRIATEPRPFSGFPGWMPAGAMAAAILALALILAQFFPGPDTAPLSADAEPTVQEPALPETAAAARGDVPGTESYPLPEDPPAAAGAAPSGDTTSAAAPVVTEPAAAEPPVISVPSNRSEFSIRSNPASPPPPAESVVVKMLTDDPDVVIYMLVEGEGDPKNA